MRLSLVSGYHQVTLAQQRQHPSGSNIRQARNTSKDWTILLLVILPVTLRGISPPMKAKEAFKRLNG